MPRAGRLIGFAGTVDLSGFSSAQLSVKVGNSPWQTKSVTLPTSGKNAVTVAQAFAFLNTASFTGVTFSADPLTNRLMAAATANDALDLQIKGKLAGALDFGQGIKYKGFGSYWKSFLDDETIGCTFPLDRVEKEDIDLEGAKGTITRMTIPAKRLGMSPVVTMKFKDDELAQIIQGGVYTPASGTTPATYDPPTSDAGGSPILTMDVFAPLYNDGASLMDQVIGMSRYLFYSCSGIEGDVPMEAKAWAQFAYNMSASEYTDENGTKWPSDKRYEYDLEQWDAFDAAGVASAANEIPIDPTVN
jgi:hypothetical protein